MSVLEEKASTLRTAWRLIKNQWIQEVPEEISICEFECRNPECQGAQWVACQKRLRDGGSLDTA